MSQANEVELEMLALINAERADAGLNPLLLNTALNEAAEDHSTWMLDQNTFSHTGIGDSSAGDRIEGAEFPLEGRYAWAENIGWQSERGAPGISDDVADIHESLMDSPGHRANLLDPNLTEIGIGVEQGDFETARGTFDGVMITQNFAATDGDISALRDPGTMGDVMDEDTAEDDVPEDAPVPETEEPVAEDTPEDPDPMPEGEDMDEPVAEDDDFDDPDVDDEDPEEEDGDDLDDPVDPESDDDAEDMEDDAPDPTPESEEPVAEAPVDEAPDDEMAEDDGPEPDSPVEPMPEPQVPTLAGLFVDFSDAFEFRQEGEKLIFETSFDALFTSLINTFEEAFGVEVALDVVDDMVPPLMPETDVIPDMSLDCA